MSAAVVNPMNSIHEEVKEEEVKEPTTLPKQQKKARSDTYALGCGH